MVLQGSIVLDNGIALTDVYIEINRVIFSYVDINDSTATDISAVSVDVEIYKDLKAYNSEKPSVLFVTHICKGLDSVTRSTLYHFPIIKYFLISLRVVESKAFSISPIYRIVSPFFASFFILTHILFP